MRTLGADVAAGRRSLLALSVVVGVAVLREGSEVVLFLYGIAASGGTSAAAMLLGGFLGVLAGAGVSALMYFGLLTIPAGRLFAATSGLITLLAAGLAAQALPFVQQGGAVEVLTTPWDTSSLLSRRQHRGTPAAHTDRIYGPAFRSSADRLSGDDRNDHRSDAQGRTRKPAIAPAANLAPSRSAFVLNLRTYSH